MAKKPVEDKRDDDDLEDPVKGPQLTIGDDVPDDPPDDPPADDEDDEPELVSVFVGGKTVKVSQDVAEALEAERAAMNKPKEPVEPSRRDDDEDDIDDLIWTDPKEYRRRIAEDIKTELRQEYDKDQSEKSFWDGFYSENPELKEDDAIVQAVLNKNMPSLGDLPVAEAKKRLAELTQQQILSIAQRHGGGKRQKNKSATLEGGQISDKMPSDGGKKPKDVVTGEGLPKSLGEAIKQRRLQRARANRPAAAG